MKYLLTLTINIYLIGLTISERRHNKNGELITKTRKKIKPDVEFCSEDNCPSERGICSSENYCYCFNGYLSTFETSFFCDYEQKDRVLYFISEFVIGFGLGHFYVGNIIYGTIKLVSYIVLFGIYFGFFYNKKGIDAARIRLFLWTIYTLWQLIDGLSIIRGIFTDGENKPTGFKYF